MQVCLAIVRREVKGLSRLANAPPIRHDEL
jgi:hypothetical protein